MNLFAPSSASAFVGREPELTVLSLLLEAATGGRGGAALIAGEPGIGKTRLLEELAGGAAESGVQVLWGRCYEGDGAPAFWPWIQILRAFVSSRPLEAVRGALGNRAAEIAALVPELASLLPGLPSPPPVAAAQERFRLFDAITASLKAVAADHPLVLLLDDLHWADTTSLLLLDFLAQELSTSRLFVAGAYRDVDLRRGDPLLLTLGNLTRRPHVTRVVLGGLGPEDVATYIEGATGAPASPDLAATITTETDGNPLYITQMVRLLAAEGSDGALPATGLPLPPSLREVIGRRLARLSGGCIAALEVAAAMGREFYLPVVASASDLKRDLVLDALEEAESAGIIEQAAGATRYFRFSHAVIRETLYDELPAIRRARLHLRLAEAIEALHGPQSVPHLPELAAHYRLAVPVTTPQKAVAYARQAGDAAAAVFAWEEAIGHWRTALDLAAADDWPMRAELLLALGEAQNHVGERALAKDTFSDAAAAARHLQQTTRGSPNEGARLLTRAALAYGGPGIVLGALDRRQVDLLEEALAAVRGRRPAVEGHAAVADDAEAAGWRGLSARLLARLALALFWTPRRQESLALSRDAVEVARQTADPRALIAALHVRRYVLWSPEHLDERSNFAREMVDLAEALEDAELTLQGLRWRIVDSLELGQIGPVDVAIARYTQLAEELRHPYYRWYASLFQATRAISAGRFVEGERLANEALAFGRRAGDPDAGMFFTMQMVPARTQQGRIAELVEPLRGLAERYPSMLAYRSRIPVLFGEQGQQAQARDAFEQIVRDTTDSVAGEFGGVAHDGNWLVTMANLARTCLLLGDAARAVTLYALLEPFADRNAVTGAGIASLGPVSHWLGGLAELLGHTDEAAAHFEAALEMAARMEALPQVAITQHAYAVLLLRARPGSRQNEARAYTLLESAQSTARALGMVSLEPEIMRTMGNRPVPGSALARRAQPSPFPDGLSAREVEVLRLVAAGHSNREIAEALVLSVVTVQNHIANIYRKADIRNRAEAATYALRRGLSQPPPM